MQPILIALVGRANCGKTTTLRRVIAALEADPKANVTRIHEDSDTCAIIHRGGVTIGIETQGDPNSRLEKSLKLFAEKRCDIIICATRTRGQTKSWVNSYQGLYKILRLRATYATGLIAQRNAQAATAASILRLLPPPWIPACPFFQINKRTSHQDHSPSDYYAQLSEASDETDTDNQLLIFEAIGAAWMDSLLESNLKATERIQPINDFTDAPLAMLTLRAKQLPLDIRQDLANASEPRWWKFTSVHDGIDGTVTALRRVTLTGEDTPVSFATAAPIQGPLSARLNTAFSLDDFPDADDRALNEFFAETVRRTLYRVRVFDVGQGLAQGICTEEGVVCLYVDYGCGVGPGHLVATRPAALTRFCFTQNPSILLSHWDWDHWGAHLIDSTPLASRWLAPRQKIAAIQRAFAVSIRDAGGSLLIWPHAPGVITAFGQIQVGRCSGPDRNHSGLSVCINAPDHLQKDPILLTGDADYRHMPFPIINANYHAVVVPHHGGNLRDSSPAPQPSPSSTHLGRLVYSYGVDNGYGHPTKSTRRKHIAAGWCVYQIRHTSRRSAPSMLGHVDIRWAGPLVTTVPCTGLIGGCHLAPSQ